MTLAFEPEDFYPPEQVDPRWMPHYSLQEEPLSQFQSRVSTVMLQAARNRQPIDLFQADPRLATTGGRVITTSPIHGVMNR